MTCHTPAEAASGLPPIDISPLSPCGVQWQGASNIVGALWVPGSYARAPSSRYCSSWVVGGLGCSGATAPGSEHPLPVLLTLCLRGARVPGGHMPVAPSTPSSGTGFLRVSGNRVLRGHCSWPRAPSPGTVDFVSSGSSGTRGPHIRGPEHAAARNRPPQVLGEPSARGPLITAPSTISRYRSGRVFGGLRALGGH